MSRSRNGNAVTLPMLRYSMDGSDPSFHPAVSPRADSRPVTPRINFLADRLSQQEKTTQSLVERAYRIKEDVIDSLNITHGTWQDEKQARELLQDHIRTITDIVRKLSRDIEFLEHQIKDREGATAGTQNTVKNLELQQVAGITDLRARVIRCDSSAARLATDVKTAFDSIKVMNHQQQDQNAKVVERMHDLDNKIREVTLMLNRTYSEQAMQLQHVESDTTTQLTGLEGKTRSISDDVKVSIQTLRITEQNEREKLEVKIMSYIERVLAQRDARMEKAEQRLSEGLVAANKNLVKLHDDLQKEKERSAAAHQSLEVKLKGMVDASIAKQNEEMSRLKHDCRDGFRTVHDSISEMKEVLEGKRKLLEEQLRKEMIQIRKMVVLI